MRNDAFPGLLGRRVRLDGTEPGDWIGVVVGWSGGSLVIEQTSGQIQAIGWRCLLVEPRVPTERPPPV